jgi:vacuolar-type H+-ATPase subunit H
MLICRRKGMPKAHTGSSANMKMCWPRSMDNNEVLGNLLKIESEAGALVDDAQAEADKRILSAEKQNHAVYEERYAAGGEKLEREFRESQEKVRQQYQTELESYRNTIAGINPDTGRFSALLNNLIAEET